MPTLATHVPDDWEFADIFSKRINAKPYRGRPGPYLRDAIERDLSGSPIEAKSPTILEDLCGELRHDLAADLSPKLVGANQPAILARLIEALITFLARDGSASERLYLVTMREAAALAMGAAGKQHDHLARLALQIAPDIAQLIEEGRIIGLGSIARPAKKSHKKGGRTGEISPGSAGQSPPASLSGESQQQQDAI